LDRLYVPFENVVAVAPPAVTVTPPKTAPAEFVTIPVTVPVVGSDAVTWMIFATEGTPALLSRNSM
jgi:hypothetical protein